MQKMTFAVALGLGAVSLFVSAAEAPSVTRVFRAARPTRGNTNIIRQQPIDSASWIWHPDWKDETTVTEGRFLKFRNRFTLPTATNVTIDVSADERFYLTLDGAFVARGPNRAVPENWQYQTYELKLAKGEHVLEATVWKTQDAAPLAQLSWRGGFILKAEGKLDKALTTGRSDKWEVGKLVGTRSIGYGGDVWGGGAQFGSTGTGLYDEQPSAWTKPVVVRGEAGESGPWIWGIRTVGWMLFPTQLPDQTELHLTPGEFKALATDLKDGTKPHVFTEAETKGAVLRQLNALLKIGTPFVVPPHSRWQAAWDLGVYSTAYPVLVTKGGKGATVCWNWAESSREEKTGLKKQRDEIVGKSVSGLRDVFACDGRERAEFSTPWFRAGKWCRIDFETGDEPLTVTKLEIVESRYPIGTEGAFAADGIADCAGIGRICRRALEMCSHEMFFDCPYYEQQMYSGDTRVVMNILSSQTADDRLIRRGIELYDLSTRDDGMAPFNWPTRGLQEGSSYTLCYLLMYGDYVMNHADREWLRARLPGLRKSMAGFEYYENADGLLENTPGWNFMDWPVDVLTGRTWQHGNAPSSFAGDPPNAEINLFWVLAMQSAAKVERALGHVKQAEYWEEKVEKLKPVIVAKFWNEARGLLADDIAQRNFSEHAQALAVVGDVLPKDKLERCFKNLVSDPKLTRCTVYFKYYLFEAYFKMGRGDLFVNGLDLWRDYLKWGLTTLLEEPADGIKKDSRSDCHAWGAHPLWFMATGLAGIRSDAPFFAKVRIAPCPGGLTELKADYPHPGGQLISVDLRFNGGKASGTVTTPVPGTFVFGDQRISLVPGANAIR